LFSLRLQFTCTNNIVKYEALLLGTEEIKSRGIQKLIVIGDSDLVVSQLRETFDTKDEKLKPYKERVTHMLKGFNDISLRAFIDLPMMWPTPWLWLLLLPQLSLMMLQEKGDASLTQYIDLPSLNTSLFLKMTKT